MDRCFIGISPKSVAKLKNFIGDFHKRKSVRLTDYPKILKRCRNSTMSREIGLFNEMMLWLYYYIAMVAQRPDHLELFSKIRKSHRALVDFVTTQTLLSEFVLGHGLDLLVKPLTDNLTSSVLYSLSVQLATLGRFKSLGDVKLRNSSGTRFVNLRQEEIKRVTENIKSAKDNCLTYAMLEIRDVANQDGLLLMVNRLIYFSVLGETLLTAWRDLQERCLEMMNRLRIDVAAAIQTDNCFYKKYTKNLLTREIDDQSAASFLNRVEDDYGIIQKAFILTCSDDGIGNGKHKNNRHVALSLDVTEDDELVVEKQRDRHREKTMSSKLNKAEDSRLFLEKELWSGLDRYTSLKPFVFDSAPKTVESSELMTSERDDSPSRQHVVKRRTRYRSDVRNLRVIGRERPRDETVVKRLPRESFEPYDEYYWDGEQDNGWEKKAQSSDGDVVSGGRRLQEDEPPLSSELLPVISDGSESRHLKDESIGVSNGDWPIETLTDSGPEKDDAGSYSFEPPKVGRMVEFTSPFSSSAEVKRREEESSESGSGSSFSVISLPPVSVNRSAEKEEGDEIEQIVNQISTL
nr:MAG: protein m32 [Herpesviridae sp.]